MPQIGSFVQGIYRDESRTTSELVAALCKASLEYLPVELDEEGSRHGQKYRYASIHSIRRATLAANCKYGLFVNHVYGENDKGEYVTSVLRHSSGEYMASTSPLPLRDDVQEAKAAKTLLCRTHSEGLLGIVTERDDDGASVVASVAVDAEQAKRWASTLALALESIAKAKDEADVFKFSMIARKRIESGLLAPDAMPAITKACEARMSQLKEVTSAGGQGTSGDQSADASGSGSGAANRRTGGGASAT